MTYARWSSDGITISGQPKASILWLYKESRSHEGIRDEELPVIELGNEVLKEKKKLAMHLFSSFSC